jgi:hypothetical protein
MPVTVSRYRCREEGELVRIACNPSCGCVGREYPAPANENAGPGAEDAGPADQPHEEG